MSKRRSSLAVVVLLLAGSLAGACGQEDGEPASQPPVGGSAAPSVAEIAAAPIATAAEPGVARLVFVGDLMMGRRVGELAALDPYSVFEDVRYVVGKADVAMANLESPFTRRGHQSDNPFRLEADPALAPLVAAAGFDVLGIANNHAGDAGAESVLDTIAAVSESGMIAVGGGSNIDSAWEPQYLEVGGVAMAVLAVDVSAQGLAAGTEPGVAVWDVARAEAAVSEARRSADVVVAGIHGGVDGWTGVDPILDPVARRLVEMGVDVVWGHGPHVAQPVVAVDGVAGRTSVVATSLGNFLFDQQIEPNSIGIILETMVGKDGLVAWRIGRTRGEDLRVHFEEWLVPVGDVVLIDGDWWSTGRVFKPQAAPYAVTDFAHGEVTAASTGDISGSGTSQLLVSYRHPERDYEFDPRPRPVDGQGRTAHIGVFEMDGTPVWMSHRPPRPVADLVACGGSAVFAYSDINDPQIIAIGAGVWNGFGFTLAPELTGAGTFGCVDVDGDGRTEPVVVGR